MCIPHQRPRCILLRRRPVHLSRMLSFAPILNPYSTITRAWPSPAGVTSPTSRASGKRACHAADASPHSRASRHGRRLYDPTGSTHSNSWRSAPAGGSSASLSIWSGTAMGYWPVKQARQNFSRGSPTASIRPSTLR